MYFWDTALGRRRAKKMEKRGCKSCVRLRVTKQMYISQGKHRTRLKLRNNNRDVPHAQIPAALHPPWPGSRRRGEDTEQPLPGSLPCGAAVSTAWLLAGSGPLPAPCVSCAGLSLWLISTVSIDLLWLPGRLPLPHLILCKVTADDSLIIPMYWGKPCSLTSRLLLDNVDKGCFLDLGKKLHSTDFLCWKKKSALMNQNFLKILVKFSKWF